MNSSNNSQSISISNSNDVRIGDINNQVTSSSKPNFHKDKKEVEENLNKDLSTIFSALTNRFNIAELKTLCFSINVDYESLAGDNKESFARELVLYCQRHNLLTALTSEIKKRPDVSL